MANVYNVFHSQEETLRRRVHVCLVRPEEPGNVGAIVRALANMGMEGRFLSVGGGACLTADAFRFAKHAKDRLERLEVFPTLEKVLSSIPGVLSVAATARVGSTKRPHPLWVREAMQRALEKLRQESQLDLLLVFGPEGDGLTNEEVALCDWVVTIPSLDQYRSLNLAQAVLIFAYELHLGMLESPVPFKSVKTSQRDKLIANVLSLAEEAGFIFTGDPHKMRPRLEKLMGKLPKQIEGVETLHGLLDQIRRSLRRGAPDYKEKYRRVKATPDQNGVMENGKDARG